MDHVLSGVNAGVWLAFNLCGRGCLEKVVWFLVAALTPFLAEILL
jgi:hypothetical protein